jgi:mannose/fructose-specific phosphotransferase system component IIA
MKNLSSFTFVLIHQSTHESFARGMAHSLRVEVVFLMTLAGAIVAGHNSVAEHLQPSIKHMTKDRNSLN